MSREFYIDIRNLKDEITLVINDTIIEDYDAKYLAYALEDSKIEYLSLTHSRINLNSFMHLTNVLQFTQIDCLNLSFINLQDEGVKVLAKALKGTNVKSLDLTANGISCVGIKFLADVLKDTRISNLNLSRNNGIGSIEGIKTLMDSLKNSQVSKLALDQNKINCLHLKCLADNLKNSKITDLSLAYNCIKDQGLHYLTKILKDTEITNLHLTKNLIHCESALSLNKILNTTKIKYLNLDVYSSQSQAFESSFVRQYSYVKNQMCHEIIIGDCNMGIDGVRYLKESFQTKEIFKFNLDAKLKESDVEYFAQALENFTIHTLVIHGVEIWEAGKYMIQAFKRSYITTLQIGYFCKKEFHHSGFQNVIEFLKEVNVFTLNILFTKIHDVALFAEAVESSNIMRIKFEGDCLTSQEVKHLSKVLRNSKITHISLVKKFVENDAIKYLADGLPGSQVTHISLDENVNCQPLLNVIERTNLSSVVFSNGYDEINALKLARKTTSVADKIRDICKTTVAYNSLRNEFEFVLPKTTFNTYRYVFLIDTVCKCPNSKVHIFNTICTHVDDYKCYDPFLMEKMNEFILAMSSKFITFFNDRLLDIMKLLGTNVHKYIELIKQFDEAGFDDIVKNLLLHRILYYVDENQEILHPYIYKMLSKYNMPLWNAQVEPNKREKIISYYQDHSEIDGAQDIIEFLRSDSCNNRTPMEF